MAELSVFCVFGGGHATITITEKREGEEVRLAIEACRAGRTSELPHIRAYMGRNGGFDGLALVFGVERAEYERWCRLAQVEPY